MPFFPIRRIRNRQPQHVPKIDYANSITKDIVFAFEASMGQRDLATTVPGEPLSSGVLLSSGSYGKNYTFSGAQGTGSCSFGLHPGLMGATSATWDILVYFDAANPTAHFFSQWDGDRRWLLQASSGSLVWVAAQDNAGNRTRWDASAVFPSSGWYRITASWRGGSSKVLVVNGVDRTSSLSLYSAAATQIGPTIVNDKLQIGKNLDGTALSGKVCFARAWKRGLSLDECLGLHASPWKIFKPEKRFLFSFSGSSGAYTLTASGGTYIVQGASAGIFRSRVLSGTGGSYTLTGGQAVVSRNRKLVASGGIYNYTGQSITITHTSTSNAYTLTAQGGSYTLSGGTALVLKSKRITSVGGVYTLTGSDAVVSKSKYLTATSGTYLLTGGTATVLKSKVLISTGGVYSYTGSSTVIKKSKYLSALGGSYSLVGSSVVLVHGGIGGIVWPPTHLVVLGTVYGPTGSEYTGTLDVNGIKYDITTGQLVKPINDKVVMSI